jgi:RNA polymerase sigma-70 factor (ECF subfamily)
MAEANRKAPDEVLVLSAIFGDLAAFDELVARYRPAAVRTACGIVGGDDAEDVAQDAFLLAFKALPSIEEPTKFAVWLGAITRNRALRFLKETGKHTRQRVELDELLIEKISALSRPLSSETEAKQELRLALEKVPKDYALVLQMHFLDEMPLKRIAAFLGAPLSTVKWRVHQGKKLLREEVENLRH